MSPAERDLLARTILGEAALEPDEGKAAVVYSVLNRKNQGGYGNSIEEILNKPKQYESWNTKGKQLMGFAQDDPSYKKAMTIVNDIADGKLEDPTGGATHFANVDIVKQRNNKSAMKWINGMSDQKAIGNHTFGKADAGRDDPLLTKYMGVENSPGADTGDDPLLAKYAVAEPEPVKLKGKTAFLGTDVSGLNEDDSALGFVKRAGVGALRGLKDVADTGATGLSYLINNDEEHGKVKDRIKAERDTYDEEYGKGIGSNIGRVVGQTAGTAPLIPAKAIQAVNWAARALPTISATGAKVAAPLFNRLRASAGTGALGGAIVGGATSAQNDESFASNVGKGALTGAVAGPVLTLAGSAAKALGSKAIGSISHTTSELAKRAEELGIPLKASQVSPNQTFKKFDQMSGMLPFSGQTKFGNNQQAAFTKAISRTFGENTDELTPKVIDTARKRIGKEIESVGANAKITYDNKLHTDLEDVIKNMQGSLPQNEWQPIINNVKNIVDRAQSNGWVIDGPAYLALTNFKATLSKAQASPNPNIRNSANEIRNALDDALQRSISGPERQRLLDARKQYKNVMTIKTLAEGDADGHVSPLRLMQKVLKMPGGKLRSGELGEIADIGRKFFPTPSDSGTPLGTAVLDTVWGAASHPVTSASALAAGVASGSGMLTGAGLATGLGVNRLLRAGANSRAVKNAIVRSGSGDTYGATNRLSEAIVPRALPAIEATRRPLEITVNGYRKPDEE